MRWDTLKNLYFIKMPLNLRVGNFSRGLELFLEGLELASGGKACINYIVFIEGFTDGVPPPPVNPSMNTM